MPSFRPGRGRSRRSAAMPVGNRVGSCWQPALGIPGGRHPAVVDVDVPVSGGSSRPEATIASAWPGSGCSSMLQPNRVPAVPAHRRRSGQPTGECRDRSGSHEGDERTNAQNERSVSQHRAPQHISRATAKMNPEKSTLVQQQSSNPCRNQTIRRCVGIRVGSMPLRFSPPACAVVQRPAVQVVCRVATQLCDPFTALYVSIRLKIGRRLGTGFLEQVGVQVYQACPGHWWSGTSWCLQVGLHERLNVDARGGSDRRMRGSERRAAKPPIDTMVYCLPDQDVGNAISVRGNTSGNEAWTRVRH